MDIRDFLKKVDNIQNKEQMKEDVKRIHVKEASQVMLYGDTPEDMNAIAQIFKSAGVTPPAPVEVPKPEAEEVPATEEVPGKANTTPKPEYKDTGYMQKDIAGGINKPKKMYRKDYPGDNPMAVETEEKTNSIKEELQKAYEDFKKKRLAERPLTKPEKRKVTHYKKKFDKKNVKKDFIKRYGKEKGTAYMYATINKMAKKNA